MNIFETGTITAFPTDTSYGLGVRIDDAKGMDRLAKLKGRRLGQYFSIMVRDMAMLREYAKVPNWIHDDWFFECPRTAILLPTGKLPKSPHWPHAVAFRVCPVPEIQESIIFPITATSCNKTGQMACYDAEKVKQVFGDAVVIHPFAPDLPRVPASEIWDCTGLSPVQIR